MPRFWCVVALSTLGLACEPVPPVKTASGERIGGVSYEEKFPLSNDANEVTFQGARLRRAVELLDKHSVFALSGDFQASGVLDKSTLVLVIRNAENRERKVVVKNCAEPHLCAFFADAIQRGLVEKLPVICREAIACTTPKK